MYIHLITLYGFSANYTLHFHLWHFGVLLIFYIVVFMFAESNK